MNEFLEDSLKPISGDAYTQNRKLLGLIRETIAQLDTLASQIDRDFPLLTRDVEDLANWLEAEVSIAVT